MRIAEHQIRELTHTPSFKYILIKIYRGVLLALLDVLPHSGFIIYRF